MTNWLVIEALAVRYHLYREEQERDAVRVGGVDPDNLAALRARLAGGA